jgi:hypothetical protein
MQQRKATLLRLAALVLSGGLLVIMSTHSRTAAASPAENAATPLETALSTTAENDVQQVQSSISGTWQPSIHRWGELIGILSRDAGIDPDLVAAVMNEESNGISDGVSRVGAVGLMGVMPTGPGLEWRPSTDELLDPEVNLRWGVGILTDIIQQSGGDIAAALAAYAGGWDQTTKRVPRQYAANVLDNYARAVLTRSGYDPSIAARWTIAVEIQRGAIPAEPLLLSEEPLAEWDTYGEHLIYYGVDREGRTLYVRGHAVPLALVVPQRPPEPAGVYSVLDPQLMARQGLVHIAKVEQDNPRVILACLPSINRLRGIATTRWFAPSSCPDWHR